MRANPIKCTNAKSGRIYWGQSEYTQNFEGIVPRKQCAFVNCFAELVSELCKHIKLRKYQRNKWSLPDPPDRWTLVDQTCYPEVVDTWPGIMFVAVQPCLTFPCRGEYI